MPDWKDAFKQTVTDIEKRLQADSYPKTAAPGEPFAGEPPAAALVFSHHATMKCP